MSTFWGALNAGASRRTLVVLSGTIVVAAAAILPWLPTPWSQPPESVPHEVSVTIGIRQAAEEKPGSAVLHAPEEGAVRNEVLADPCLAQTVTAGDPSASISLGEVRTSLAVAVRTEQDQVRVALHCRSRDAERAARWIGLAAAHYADRCRGQLETQADRLLQATQADAQHARGELNKAQIALREFLEPRLREPSHESARGEVPAAANDAAPRSADPNLVSLAPEPAAAPAERDSAAIASRLARERQQLAVALTKRTPLHPEVQRLLEAIADDERQINQLPASVSESTRPAPSGNPSADSPAPPSASLPSRSNVPSEAVALDAKALQEYRGLQAALASAARAEQAATASEQSAWQARLALPRVDVAQAEVTPAERRAAPRPAGIAWILVLTLAAVAAGVGLAQWGARETDRPWTNAVQISRALRLPVVGMVTAGPIVQPKEAA